MGRPDTDKTAGLGDHQGAGPQQLDRLTETHPTRLHLPVDYAPSGLARAHAVQQVLRRRHHQRRLPVVVKRTSPGEIGAVPPQLDPEAPHQPLQRHFFLELLDLFLGNARDPKTSSKTDHTSKPVKYLLRYVDSRI